MEIDPDFNSDRITKQKIENQTRHSRFMLTHIAFPYQSVMNFFLFSQEPFETETCFLEELDEEQTEGLKHELRHVDIDHLLADLTEYITLELPERRENDKGFP